MSKKNRRQKASDVFNAKETFLGKSTFEKAFPNINSLKVSVKEEGKGVNKYNVERFYSSENAGEFIDCNNSLCYNGGFHLGEIIRSMIQKNENGKKVTKYCQGYEGSPKGRNRYDDCDNRFTIEINIEYKK